MALKTLTAVTNINNLSDARYCAGMGVDIVSFNLSGQEEGALNAQAVKEISGWLAGVQLAGAFAGTPVEAVNALAKECQLDLIQLDTNYLLDDLTTLDLPVILQVNITKDTFENELAEMLALYQPHVRYFLLTSDDFTTIDETNHDLLTHLANRFPVLVGFGLDKENVLTVLETIKPDGLALKGGHEIKPGLRNFDDLADILETLEEE